VSSCVNKFCLASCPWFAVSIRRAVYGWSATPLQWIRVVEDLDLISEISRIRQALILKRKIHVDIHPLPSLAIEVDISGESSRPWDPGTALILDFSPDYHGDTSNCIRNSKFPSYGADYLVSLRASAGVGVYSGFGVSAGKASYDQLFPIYVSVVLHLNANVRSL
jgi:hypothetical protein